MEVPVWFVLLAVPVFIIVYVLAMIASCEHKMNQELILMQWYSFDEYVTKHNQSRFFTSTAIEALRQVGEAEVRPDDDSGYVEYDEELEFRLMKRFRPKKIFTSDFWSPLWSWLPKPSHA